ncbi:methionine aminopeptidase, type I, partial [Sphaeroforma arctica JP610]
AGTTTDEIDRKLHNLVIQHNAYPSPLNYMGFQKSICTSINNIQVHGVPDTRMLESGDIINIDISVYVNGFHGDLSETVCVGKVNDTGRKLRATKRIYLSSIDSTVVPIASEAGFTISENFVGHGIGREFHTPPNVLHHKNRESKMEMKVGMVFTIEPILCEGSPEMSILEDGWTAISRDGGRSAQFEHTVAITENGVEVLTLNHK